MSFLNKSPVDASNELPGYVARPCVHSDRIYHE